MVKLGYQKKSQEGINFGNQMRDRSQFFWMSKKDTFGNGQTGRSKKSQEGMNFGNQIRDRFQFLLDVEKGTYWE